MKNLIPSLFIALILFFSCQTNRKVDESVNVVDIKTKREVYIDQDTIKVPELKKVETSSSEDKESRKKIISLFIDAQGLSSIAALPILQELENHSVFPKVIGGRGFGALIAAYYVQGVKFNLVEWKFFKFISEIESNDIQVGSREWRELVDEVFLKDFQEKTLENSKDTLFIPFYNSSKGSLELVLRGDLQELLRKSLFHLEEKPLRKSQLEELGVDLSIYLDFNARASHPPKDHNLIYVFDKEEANPKEWSSSKMNDSLLKSRNTLDSFSPLFRGLSKDSEQ